MLVAKYWAEARLQHKLPRPRRQITIKRLGWSNKSQQAAEEHAQQRVNEAMTRALNNPGSVDWRSRSERAPSIGYNGAEGLPIREEVIQTQDDWAITRNTYGALCLNTPDVLFIDIDDQPAAKIERPKSIKRLSRTLIILTWLACIGLFGYSYVLPHINEANPPFQASLMVVGIFSIVSLIVIGFVYSKAISMFYTLHQALYPPLKRIEAFAKKHPTWIMNLYRTPAGYRLLVLHQTFDPTDEKLWHELRELGIDPMYQLMCQKQNCFRARLTPKPWRMNMEKKIPEGRKIWQADYANSAERIRWVTDYTALSRNYASCHWVKNYNFNTLGILPKAKRILQMHDQLCQAYSKQPLA